MGYQTYFNVEAQDVPDDQMEAVNEELQNSQLRHEMITYGATVEGGSFSGNGTCYEHEQYAQTLTKRIAMRNIVLRITGDGEESGDQWVKFFKNGKKIAAAKRGDWVYPDKPEDCKGQFYAYDPIGTDRDHGWRNE